MGRWGDCWVTRGLDPEECLKAIVLSKSLKRTLTSKKTVILLSPHIPNSIWENLESEFDVCIKLDYESDLLTGITPEVYAQLYCCKLFKCSKVVYLDPNSMMVNNADFLFDATEVNKGLLNNGDASNADIFLINPSVLLWKNVAGNFGKYQKESIDRLDSTFPLIVSEEPKRCIPVAFNTPVNLKDRVLAKNLDELIMVKFQGIHPLEMLCGDAAGTASGIMENALVNLWKTDFMEGVADYAKLFKASPAISNLVGEALEMGPELHQNYEGCIAVVGMSCRFPRSDNIQEFWNLLVEGKDGIGLVPEGRWTPDRCIVIDEDSLNSQGGFLKCPVDQIDGKFFEMSPMELSFMDPQQRLTLQVAWEALEDAGIDPTSLKDTYTGVYGSLWRQDYLELLSEGGATQKDFLRSYLGNSMALIPARISHYLGLTGPSIVTESGCSSSMVAVHMACKSLLRRETELSLACGVNLLLHPFTQDTMSTVLAQDGHCKTFDADADGFGRAEGCGVLVLKRYEDAVRDGDRVWGLIRGTAVVQEGASRSLGTPTKQCEALAMQMALDDAGVEAKDVSFVETHGTGTPVGDPLEFAAVTQVFSHGRGEPLIIGSVKTNIGHTESCSGIAGIIKVLLSLNHEMIPPHRNLTTLNPLINLESIPAVIPLEATPWKRDAGGKPRIAGVSSFGITGTDAHAIIQETPQLHIPKLNLPNKAQSTDILTISAKTEEALDDKLVQYKTYLQNTKESLTDICFSANTGRAHFSNRAYIVGSNVSEVAEKLKTVTKVSCSEERPKLCFLFTGQGSQYPGMAKDLYDSSPTFRIHFDQCDRILIEEFGISIKDTIWGENSSNLGRSVYSQTSIFCVEYCLLKLWESWGVKPDFVLGHSLGEFAAQVGAGIMTFKDALSLVAHRSTLIDALPNGKMIVVKESYENTQNLIKKAFEGTKLWLDFAAVNSADQTVLAGSEDSILKFKEFCKNNKIKTHILDATHAFHSRHMDPILETYRDFASKIKYSSPTCTYVSGMEGRIHQESDPEGGKVDGDYWVRHTREGVRYADACKQVLEQGVTHFLELGPQPVLSALTIINSDSVPALQQPVQCFPSMRKNESNWTTILDAAGKLYSQGISINWPRLYQFREDKKKVSLPFYPFQNKTHWFEIPERGPGPIHPLVGTPLPNPSNIKLFSNTLDIGKLEFLKDHAIGNKVVFPGAGFLEMCLVGGHGATQCTETTYFAPNSPVTLENFSILSPLGLSETETSQMQVIVSSEESGETLVSVYSKLVLDRETYKWIHHASATFSPYAVRDKGDEDISQDTLEAIQQRCTNPIFTTETYGKLAEFGFKFGPTFQTIGTMWKGDSEYLFQIKVTENPSKYVCHPVISDAMFQAVMIASNPESDRLYVPVSVNKFIWFAKIGTDLCFIHCKIKEDSSGEVIAALYDNNGQLLAIMVGASLVETTVSSIMSALEAQKMSLPPMYEDVWRAQLGPEERRADSQVAINPEVFNPQTEKDFATEFNLMSQADTLFVSKTNDLYALYIIKGLHDLGFLPNIGESISFKDFVNKYNILPSLEGFARYLLVELVKEGYFEQINPNSREEVVFKLIKSLPTYEKVLKGMDELYQDVHPESPLELEYVSLTGKRLAVFLTGKESALPILFPEDAGSSASAETYYRESKMSNWANKFLAKFFRSLFYTLGKAIEETKCIVRILEVGAGTGSFTKPLIPHLEEHAHGYEFTYTDLSQIFFQNGRKVFEGSKVKVEYRILNVEEDPVEQGFIPHHYDLVIANSVLHATRNITETIINLRNMVRENGILLISECIKPSRNTNLTFGCIDGYWRFQDFDLRPFNCELTCDQWKGVLQACDFPLVSTYPIYLDHGGTIVGRAGTSSTYKSMVSLPKGIPKKNKTWILFGNDDGITSEFFHKQLESFGGHVIRVYNSDYSTGSKGPHSFSIRTDNDDDILTIFKRVLKDSESSLEGVVYLWGMDANTSDYSRIVQPFLSLCKSLIYFEKVRLLVVTRGVFCVTENGVSVPQVSPILAMTKGLQNEQPSLICRCVDLEDSQHPSGEQLKEALSELVVDDGEVYVAYRSNQRFVCRCIPWKVSNTALSFPKSERFRLVLAPTNAIADLKFGAMEKTVVGELNVEIRVKVFALNFRDVFAVIKPSVEFETINSVGYDYAGLVTAVGSKVTRYSVGDSVFGLNIGRDALPSHIVTVEDVICPLPQGMTYCEAATIPAVGSTAYMCLIKMAKLTKEDTILIHTASGGVGICAVQMAQSIGARIIATAGSKRKRAYLRNLGVKYIYNSRNTNYGTEILRDLEGKGVDVVLNSLTSTGFKEASLGVCNPKARFIEMSKLNTWTNEEVAELRPDVKYEIADLSAEKGLGEIIQQVHCAMKDAVITSIPYVRFDVSEIRDALTYLQKAKHIGKIVCVMPEPELAEKGLISATPNGFIIPMFNEESTYLITGGLGGIGMEVAKWMVQTGAKNLVLVGRSPPNEKALDEIGRMNLNGNNVLSLEYDVGDRSQCMELLERLKSKELNLPTLRGVMHAAGVLSDAVFPNQTWEKYQTTYNPKVDGSWNLHQLTLDLPLEHFVMFSSAASCFGGLGQSNHASANFFLDSLATYRNSIGLPANTINWGQWGQVGVAANMEVVGIKPFSTFQGILALDTVLKSQKLQVCVAQGDCGIFLKVFPSSRKYLEELKLNLTESSAELSISNEQFWNDYDGAESDVARLETVKKFCRVMIRNILKLDNDDPLNDEDKFQDLGMDSLMMIEMKNVVQSTLGKRATITVNSVKDCNTVSLLADRLCQLLSGGDEIPPPTREELIELINLDSILPDNIQLPNQFPVKPSEIQILFMTGVTGNMGPYLLRDISQRPTVNKIYVLMREDNSVEAGRERLEKVLASKGLLEETKMDKIVCVQGSVTQSKLGMDEETYELLSESVEGVIHLAVKSNFTDCYKKNDKNDRDIRTVNVKGTVNVLEFVGYKRTKVLFHASSLVASGGLAEDSSISEEWPLPGEFDLMTNTAYPISKYVCDRLMAEAVHRGFPIKVFRFPAVGGDSSSGANVNYDNNQLMLRLMSYLHLGIMPNLPIPFFILPVDVCSSLSLTIFFDDHTPNELYNIFNPFAHNETDLVLIGQELGYKIDILEVEDFTEKLSTYDDSTLIHFLKETSENKDAHERLLKDTPTIVQSWTKNPKGAFLSKKLTKLIPEYPEGIENPLEIIKRDLLFAKSSGIFTKFGI